MLLLTELFSHHLNDKVYDKKTVVSKKFLPL